MSQSLFDYGYKKNRGQFAVGERPVLIVMATTIGQNLWQHQAPRYQELFFPSSPFLYNHDGSTIKSIAAFFEEMSNGRFTWKATNPAVVPVTLSSLEGRESLAVRGGIILRRLRESGAFDFSPFVPDTEEPRFMTVVYEKDLGVVIFDNMSDEAASTTMCEHKWEISKDRWASLLLNVTFIGQRANFATIAHELCHIMGFDSDIPVVGDSRWLVEDVYGPDQSLHQRVSLMGPTITGNPANPTPDRMDSYHLDPFNKLILGWIEPRLIDINKIDAPLVLASVGTRDPTGMVILYDPVKSPQEYFILEYRTNTHPGSGAFDDREGPAGPNPTDWPRDGLAIWHVVLDGEKRSLKVTWPSPPPPPPQAPTVFHTVFLEGAPQATTPMAPQDAPGFMRGGNTYWQEGMVTPVLRWWDGTSTGLRLSVRTYPRAATHIIVDVHGERVNLPRSSALISPAPGRFELIGAGRGSEAFHTSMDVFQRQAWQQPPEIVAPSGSLLPGTEPTLILRSNGQTDLFWVGAADSAIWCRTRLPTEPGWSSPQAITPPGVASAGSRIRAVSRHPDHLDLFWANDQGALLSTWMDRYAEDGSWNNHLFTIAALGQVATPWSVFALAPSPERLEVFWIGATDGALWRRLWWLDRRVPTWFPAAALFQRGDVRPDSAIVGISRDVNHVDLFWIDNRGDIRHAHESPDNPMFPLGAWQQGSSHPATAAPGTDLSLSQVDDRQLRLFVLDAGGTIQSLTYSVQQASVLGVDSLPNSATALRGRAIATADQPFGHVDVAFVRRDLSVGHQFRDDAMFARGNDIRPRSTSTGWQSGDAALPGTAMPP